MRTTTWISAGLIIVLAVACGDDASPGQGDGSEVDTAVGDGEVSAEVGPDGSDDTNAPDTAPDTAIDTSEVAPETSEDTSGDTTPDEVDQEVVTPGELAIARGDRCDALVDFADPALPFTDEGDTSGAGDDYIYTTGAACGGPAGQSLWGDASPDLVYAFTPAITGTYRIELTPSGDYDPGLMVTDACPPIGEDGFSALTCQGASDQGQGVPEVLRVELVANTRYYLLVDGWSNDTAIAGAFALSIAIGEDCDDGLDNDDNTLVDCADPQCGDDPRCDESSYEEGCNNGADDDGDGAGDCADADCDGSPLCNEATAGSCDNGLDDEGDGRIDCADPDCDAADNCDEATYEGGCANESDDDGDGLTDCDDPDCGREAACLVVGETCETAVTLALDVPVQGTTTGRTSDYGTTSATCTVASSLSDSFGIVAPDAAYRFTPPTTGKYVFETVSDFDDAITVTSDCAFAGGSVCFGVERAGTGGERIVVDLVADVPVFVIVDGWSNSSASNSGDFTLTARRATSANAELDCADGSDGDNDGDVDCADADCAFDRAHCVEVGNCDDGVDNDGDEDVDCDDSDCRSDIVACPPPAGDNCSDPAMIDTLATELAIDTCEFGVDFMFTDDGSCVLPTFESPDAVLGFVAPADGQYLAEVRSSSVDSIVNLVLGETCPSSAVTACDGASDAFDTQRVSMSLTAGEHAWLIVSAYGDDWFEEPACGVARVAVYAVDPEVCDDESDNDRDGLADCADVDDCALAPNCNEAENGPGACGNGLDEDGDGVSDCFDIDCAGTAECPDGIPGDGCASPLEASGALWKQVVDVCNYTNAFTADETGGCQSSSGTPRDVLVRYEVAEAGDYRVRFDPGVGGASSYDALVNVVKGASCPTSPLTSCAGGSDSGDPEAVTVSAAAGEVLWVIAGGWASGCGRSEIALWKVGAEVCGDGVDNDVNGLADCADAACDQVPECIEVCDDKLDNDADGKIDCADTSCDASPLCNEAANGADACGDGEDDDQDGVADCYDPDCAEDAACPVGLVGDTCASAPRVEATTWQATFSTCGHDNDLAQSSTGGCRTMGSAGDVMVHFVAPEDGDYAVSLTSGIASTPTFDSVINVVEGEACPSGSVAACVAGVDDGVSAAVEALTLTATAGQSFWILADGYATGCGVATLAVTRLADEICDDTVDNDGDGAVDCDDTECRANEPVLCPSPAGDVCGESAIAIGALPWTDESVDTCLLARDYEPDDVSCVGYSGAEAVYRYTASEATTLRIFVQSLDTDGLGDPVDLVLSASAQCPAGGTLGSCIDSADAELDLGEEIEVAVEAGQTIYVFAAPYYGSDCTRLSIEVSEVTP